MLVGSNYPVESVDVSSSCVCSQLPFVLGFSQHAVCEWDGGALLKRFDLWFGRIKDGSRSTLCLHFFDHAGVAITASHAI
jgi:hypothetical protein